MARGPVREIEADRDTADAVDRRLTGLIVGPKFVRRMRRLMAATGAIITIDPDKARNTSGSIPFRTL